MSNAFNTSNAPTTEPLEIVAGDYIAWKRADLADYDNALFTLSYECRSEGQPARQISIAAVNDGDDYLIVLTSLKTATYTTANYHWSAFITRISDGARITIDSGMFSVTANKATSSDDPRTLPLQMLASIEQALLKRATNNQLDVLAYSLGTETSATRDPAQLLMHRDYWNKEFKKANRKARARKGLKHSGFIRTRF